MMDTPMVLGSLTRAICSLAKLQHGLSKSSETGTKSVLGFWQLCCAVEHRLLCVQWPADSWCLEDRLSQATRQALILCISMLFRTFHPSAPILVASQKRLVALLTGLDTSAFGDVGQLKRMLWILCVGGVSCPLKRQQWYAERMVSVLGRVCKEVGWDSWQSVTMEELRVWLREFVWESKLDDVGFRALWKRCRSLSYTGDGSDTECGTEDVATTQEVAVRSRDGGCWRNADGLAHIRSAE